MVGTHTQLRCSVPVRKAGFCCSWQPGLGRFHNSAWTQAPGEGRISLLLDPASQGKQDFVAPGPRHLVKAGFCCSWTQLAGQGRILLLLDPTSPQQGKTHQEICLASLGTEVRPVPMELSCLAQVPGPGATKPRWKVYRRGWSRSNERRNPPGLTGVITVPVAPKTGPTHCVMVVALIQLATLTFAEYKCACAHPAIRASVNVTMFTAESRSSHRRNSV